MKTVCFVAPIPYRYSGDERNKDKSGGIATWTGQVIDYIEEFHSEEIGYCFVDTSTTKRPTEGARFFRDRVFASGIQLLRIIRDLNNHSKATCVDVVHLTTSGGLGLVRDQLVINLCHRRGIPVVYHLHYGRLKELFENNSKEAKIQITICRKADWVIVMDSSTYHILTDSARLVNVNLVPNPIDVDSLLRKTMNIAATRNKNVCYLGWLVETKGIFELIDCWNNISQEFSDWNLKLIGSCTEEFKAKIADRSNGKNMSCLGELAHDDAMIELVSSSIFVLPSYSEGFPNCVLEAMALGLPIVATDVGAIGYMLHDQAEYVVPSRDAVSLEKALCKLMGDFEKRASIGRNNQMVCKAKFSISVVFKQLDSIWNRVVLD